MSQTDWDNAVPASQAPEEFKRTRRQKALLSSPPTDRVPPHSGEAEKGVLGCILLAQGEGIHQCIDKFRDGIEVFYDLRHRAIYEVLVQMHSASEPIDLITVQQRLRDRNQLEGVGGLTYLSSLPDVVPSAASLDYYADIVAEKHTLRKLISTCTEITSRAYEHQGEVNQLLDEIGQDITSICRRDRGHHHVTSSNAVERFSSDIERRWLREGPSGILTGLHDFDNWNDGMQPGEQFIIGARPSQGKSALGLHLLYRACIMDEVPTMFISLEMPTESLMRRLASRHCRIPMSDLRDGNISQEQFASLAQFNQLVASRPLTIHDFVNDGASDQLIASIIKRGAEDGIRLVIIDYLQIISASKKNREKRHEIGSISGTLRAAAVQSRVALVTLAQLNREADKLDQKRKPRHPRVSDIAESAQIERDADVIGLIYRDEEPGGLTHLLIKKNRDGMSGYGIPLNYNVTYQEFTNATRHQEQAP